MTTAPPENLRFRWRLFAFLAAAILIAGIYLVRFVGPYLSFDPVDYDYFWPWRFALWAHLGGGLIALLTGPIQIWLGLTRQRLPLHRTLGKVYLGAATLGLSGAYYLIAHEIASDWVFDAGLLGLALAWTLTTGIGYLAIRRGLIQQHRDWMIRSYVVAFSFVFFRVFIDLVHSLGIRSGSATGTGEEYKLAAWLCWAVPLLVAEPLIQWRHLRARPARTLGTQPPDAA
jgi:uncharacterized membrane protein